LSLIRLVPSFESYPGLTAEEQSWQIAKEYGICNGWRVNFAIDQSGSSFGQSGSSADVSNHLDRLVLGKLRSLADVIVTSGSTARAEKYKSSKHAPIAIFTRTGDLDVVPAIQGTQYFTPLILTPKANLSEVQEALSDVDALILDYAPEDALESWPKAIATTLQHEGFQSPVLESGRSTLRAFFAAGVIDELCLTVTQSTNQGLSARELSIQYLSQLFGDLSGFELVQLFSVDGSSFSRWVRSGVADL
jgi:riboflavin biosynthesis pyrimidine reductase